jgi:hypothetical protein
MAMWSTQPPTEISTRNLPGGKGRPVREADNLTICELSRKCGSLSVSQSYGPSWPVTGMALPYLIGNIFIKQKILISKQIIVFQTNGYIIL